MPAPRQALSRRRRRRRCRARSRHHRWPYRCSIAQRARDVGLGRVSKLWRSERSWVARCRDTETSGSLRAMHGRVVAHVEVRSAKLEARDGGLHVLRVGGEWGCIAFLLPRTSGQSGCDRLIFMLLREVHALNCRRPLRAERMVESKWLSRSSFRPGGRGHRPWAPRSLRFDRLSTKYDGRHTNRHKSRVRTT